MGQAQSAPSMSGPAASLSANAAEVCPVDHKTREKWLDAARHQQQSNDQPRPAVVSSVLPEGHPSVPATAEASACPVDDKARQAWLRAAQRQPPAPLAEKDMSTQEKAATTTSFRPRITNSRLSTDREISTIPRALPGSAAPANPLSSSATPRDNTSPPPSYAHGAAAPSANAQTPSTSDIHTSSTGHWVYPSESMFFEAMRRKQYSPQEKEMKSVVPLHNAVNEQTWREILDWERGQGSEVCGGPKLVSFSGDSTKLTPRAWARSMLGYQKPFDRHDWVVERCGKQVDYVIDFYEGKTGAAGKMGGNAVSFYLDVRPKLNSLEGCRMRFAKYWGWS